MDKNIIRQHLKETFLSEATTPAEKLGNQIMGKNKKANKDGVSAIAKDVTKYEKSLTKPDANEKTMAQNKFNYTDDSEKEYHDEMEIMNGMEMNKYDREPDKLFKERALEAIEGSSKMGNNPEWANVVVKGQGGDPEFGKNLVKKIKASEKKRAQQTPTSKMFGDDWEVVKDEGHKSYAFENVEKKNLLNENWISPEEVKGDFGFYSDMFKAENGVRPRGYTPDELANWLNTNYTLDGKQIVKRDDSMKGLDADYEKDSRAQQYGINQYNENKNLQKDKLYDRIYGVSSEKVEGCGDYGFLVEFLKDGTDNALELCVYVANVSWEPYEPATLEYPGYPGGIGEIDFNIVGGKMITDEGERPLTPEEIKMISNDNAIIGPLYKKLEDIISNEKLEVDPEMGGYQYNKLKRDYPFRFNENTNKKSPQIKESMKRLKFKKEFNGVGNALKMIPENYKVDKKVFEMTDGNESYRVRWEGTLTEGKAVVLMAADKKMVNEDIQKMKHLMGYKSEETLGTVKGKDRITENAKFADIFAKTKRLMEMEDIDGQDAEKEAEFDKADISHAPEAKKHVQGSVSTEKGTQAPKPKEGHWDKISVPQAAEAKKHVEGSTSTEKGTKAPKPKTGDLDDAVSQAPEAKKHVEEKKAKLTTTVKKKV